MAAAAILKIGLMAISRPLLHIFARNFIQRRLKTIPTSHFAVKIQFPQNSRWRRLSFWNSL